MRPILYCGNFHVSWSTETYVANSFFDIGQEVVRVQENEVSSDDCIELACRYDPLMFLYTRTWGLKDGPDAAFKVWEAMRRKGIPTATLSLDLYWGLNREPMIHNDPMFRTDIVFTADGGRQEDFKQAGINHIWLPPAVYGRDCFRGRPRDEFKCDVAFLGSYQNYHSEHGFRKCMVDALKEKYGPRFRLWGDRNNKRGWELNDIYASTKVIAGDSINRPRYFSDRISETVGRGGFIIFPNIEGLDECYKEGEHFIGYQPGNLSDLTAKIDEWLDDSKAVEREAIRVKGMKWVEENHTYAHRVARIIKEVESYVKGTEANASTGSLSS